MFGTMKKFVYLQRSNHNTAAATACNVSRFGHFLCSRLRRYTAVCNSRKASTMDVLTAVCWFEQAGKGAPLLLCPNAQN